MESKPIIGPGTQSESGRQPMSAWGRTLVIEEWKGSGPGYLHVHYEDDEAWHVLEGTLRFRFSDREVDAEAGTTVFVPAGTPHTYEVVGSGRYLMILTPRLRELIDELHRAPLSRHPEIMRHYRSEVLETLKT